MSTSNNSSNPQPRDVFESQFNRLLEYHAEDRKRLYESKGQVEVAFRILPRILRGTNDSAKLQRANKLTLTTPTTENKDEKIDVSGWDIANAEFFDQSATIDKCHSLLFDVFMEAIMKLARADEVQNIRMQQSISAGGNNQQAAFVQDKRGLVDQFRDWVTSLKPQWKQDYQHGMSIVSDLFEYLKNTRTRWEDYKSQHWQNMAKAIQWDASEFASELFEELEALDDVRMRTLFLIDIGYRLQQSQDRKDLMAIAGQIVESKTAQLQEASMGLAMSRQSLPQQPQQHNGH